MKKNTTSWLYIPYRLQKYIKENDININIGDNVIDMFSNEGIFTVEDIDKNGWVWGSNMKKPYCDNDEKNYIDNNMCWKYIDDWEIFLDENPNLLKVNVEIVRKVIQYMS